MQKAQQSGSLVRDPYNNDLWANLLELPPARSAIAVRASETATSAPDPQLEAERAAIARMRGYRRGGLHILRGEFHRHSEISSDGGADGSILDQWRYILDTA